MLGTINSFLPCTFHATPSKRWCPPTLLGLVCELALATSFLWVPRHHGRRQDTLLGTERLLGNALGSQRCSTVAI